MSSSSDPLQNSFDSYEPKQELESPFLNEEYLADEARIAQWRVPLPGVQLESPFLEAFEDGWGSMHAPEMENMESTDEDLVSEGETGIIDGDDRVQIKKTDSVPWRWICKIFIKDSKGRISSEGTGLLISDRHILTAAHVIYQKYIDPYSYSIEVIPAFSGGDEPFGMYAVSKKPKISKWYDPEEKNHLDFDYALITLEDRVGQEKFSKIGGPLCYWGHPQCGANTIFTRLDPKKLNQRSTITAGYPGKKGGKQLWCAKGILYGASEKGRRMFMTSDATAGQSGSPVWVKEDDKDCLVGIVVAAGTTRNFVVRVTRELIAQIQTWIREDRDTPTMSEVEGSFEIDSEKNSSKFSNEEYFEAESQLQDYIDQKDEIIILEGEIEQILGNQEELKSTAFRELFDELEEEEILWEEVAELMPPRVFQSEIDQVQIDYKTPPVHLFEHWFQPMKRDTTSNSWIADGTEKTLVPINPGFFDTSDTLKTSSLNDSLKDLLTRNPAFSQHLSKDALRDGKAKGQDKIRVALVDLTGSKLLYPEFAGWGSTVAVDGASCIKVAPLYAAFQLRMDLQHIADAEKITQMTELIKFMEDQWKKSRIDNPPRLRQFLDLCTSLPDIKFSTDVEIAISNIIDQHKANNAAKVLIDIVGFHFIASLMWQSGLRHPTRGGLWLTSNYDGGMRWRKPSMPLPTPVYGHNATALSLATFFTLLAQDRLVKPSLPKSIKTTLSNASWFQDTLPSASIASKVGLLLECLRRGPKMRGSLPVLDKNNIPVLECKETRATHVHEAAFIENGKVRYAVAIMTTGIPTGISLLQNLIRELDSLIRSNNP